MKTTDGQPMSGTALTQPIGTALRIAPGFVATAQDDTAGIETTLDAYYNAQRGRYIVRTIVNRAISDNFDEERLRHTAPQAIMQTAIPYCIAVRLDDAKDAKWLTIADLTTNEGRIIPEWMAHAVVKRGMKGERWDVIEILYGTSALSDLPPVKMIALELNVPERTASDWIKKARDAGRLVGLTSNVGRPVSD